MGSEMCIRDRPKIVVKDTAVDAIAHGAQLAVPGVVKLHEGIRRGDLVAIMTLKGELVAVGKAEMSSEEIVSANRGIAASVVRVFMEPGVYPKAWKRAKESSAPRSGEGAG